MAPAGSASAPLSPAGGVLVLQGASLRVLENGFRYYTKMCSNQIGYYPLPLPTFLRRACPRSRVRDRRAQH